MLIEKDVRLQPLPQALHGRLCHVAHKLLQPEIFLICISRLTVQIYVTMFNSKFGPFVPGNVGDIVQFPGKVVC
jgi:hypothetical protein